MKLFNVIGKTKRDGIINELYVAKTNEEAIDRFDNIYGGHHHFCSIETEEIDEVDGYKIILGKDKTSYITIPEITSTVNCRNCGFDIYIYPNQNLVVCEHCGTHNNLRIIKTDFNI